MNSTQSTRQSGLVKPGARGDDRIGRGFLHSLSLELTRPAGGSEVRDTSFGWPSGLARSRSAANLLLSVFGFLLLFWLVLSLGSYFLVVAPREQRFDFFPRWVGTRSVLRGENPYSDEITWQIQDGMFGRRLQPGEDQQRFAYSATITWPLLPFWLLPFPWAASLWLGLQLLLLLVLPIWVASILGWQLRVSSLVLLLIFSIVLFRYPRRLPPART